MQGRLDISIGSMYQDCFDEITAFAQLNNISVSKAIGESVSEYMLKMKNKPKIILESKLWNLGEYSKKDLLELELQISTLQKKVFKQIAK